MKLVKSITSLGCGAACMAGAWGMLFIAGMTGQEKLLIPAAGMAGGGLYMAGEAIVALLPEKKDNK